MINTVAEQLETAAPVDSATRVLVVSDIPGIAETVALNVGRGDPDLRVRSDVMTLADLEKAGPLLDTDLVIFGIRPGDDDDIAALRALKESCGPKVKFLGLTSDPLSLAVARGLMDAGLDEVMPLAAAAPRLVDAAKLAPIADETQAKRGTEARDGVIVAVASARGGLGATGFVLNLATMLTRRDKKAVRAGQRAPRVAIVDLDFQNGVLGASIDIADPGGYMAMLQTGQHPDHDSLGQTMVTHRLGFDVMAAPETVAPLDAMSPDMVAVLLDELRSDYDIIVLDLPRALTDWTAPILARSDRMFMLTDPAVHTIRQTRRILDLFQDDNPTLDIDLVVATQRKPFSAPAHVKEAERFVGAAFDYWMPRDDAAALKAAGQGVPLAEAAPRSAVIKAMQPMVASLQETIAQTQRRRV